MITKTPVGKCARVRSPSVEALYVTRDDVLNKLPRDILSMLDQNCKKKTRWLDQRIVSICSTIGEVSKWDNVHETFKEQAGEASRYFPKASASAMVNMKNLKINYKEGSPSKVSQTRNDDFKSIAAASLPTNSPALNFLTGK